MKKGLRIALISILSILFIFMMYWFLRIRREIPLHARCIPKNAFAVMTLNIRELALDRSFGGHLFPEMEGKKNIHKELDPFIRAIEDNNGIGLYETADVLAFSYQEGDAAFLGVVASMKDSTKFGKLIREQISKQIPIHPFSLSGTSLVRFDTSSAVLGWNNDLTVFLFPISDHGAEFTGDQCAKLLAQAENQSVLTNANFRDHEMSSFDAGIWIQTEALIKFTGGGKLFRTAFDDAKYISLALDFKDGELDIQRTIEGDGKKHNLPFNSTLLLNCDPKLVKGFWKIPIDLSNDSLVKLYSSTPPFNMLPLNDEQYKKLASTLDGTCTVLFHDTLSYNVNYITYQYDENFNGIPKSEVKRETTNGISACFGLKNEKAAKQYLTDWMQEDSIPFNGVSWLIENEGATQRMMISENVLTISNWPKTDGKKREIPKNFQGFDFYFPLADNFFLLENSSFFYFFSKYESGKQLLTDNIKVASISTPIISNNKRVSQIRLTMANKDVNALVQMEELVQKILDEGK